MGYVEVGENIPCAPLQFAFIRGAARQYGGRPWGAYVSNWFRGVVADTRFRQDAGKLEWRREDYTDGPVCGHSPHLEFRLEVAAHLAGATFVHHESDAHHGSIFAQERSRGAFVPSPFGKAMQTWHAFANEYTDRGVPYTPVAFMLDFHHGWRPREDIYGLWPQERADKGIENLFRHAYRWNGRLDFERGYLTNSPYGDIFDVITNNASGDVLKNYAVIWPTGAVDISPGLRDTLIEYVRGGGILVLDSALAGALSGGIPGGASPPPNSLCHRHENRVRSVPGPLHPLPLSRHEAPRRQHRLGRCRHRRAPACVEPLRPGGCARVRNPSLARRT